MFSQKTRRKRSLSLGDRFGKREPMSEFDRDEVQSSQADELQVSTMFLLARVRPFEVMAYRILGIRTQIRPNWEVQLTYISFLSYLLCRFMLYFFDIFMSKITSDKTAGKQFSLILVCRLTDIYGKVQKQSREENCKK